MAIRSAPRGIAEHLSAQEEAPLDDHRLPGLHTAQNRIVVPDRRAEPNLALDELARQYPEAQVRREVRWVDEGRLITAAGISAGIDMSLHLVERLAGRGLAEEVARYMEYRWQEQ